MAGSGSYPVRSGRHSLVPFAPTESIGAGLTVAIGQASKALDRLCDCHLEPRVAGNNGCLCQAECSLPLLDVCVPLLALRHRLSRPLPGPVTSREEEQHAPSHLVARLHWRSPIGLSVVFPLNAPSPAGRVSLSRGCTPPRCDSRMPLLSRRG